MKTYTVDSTLNNELAYSEFHDNIVNLCPCPSLNPQCKWISVKTNFSGYKELILLHNALRYIRSRLYAQGQDAGCFTERPEARVIYFHGNSSTSCALFPTVPETEIRPLVLCSSAATILAVSISWSYNPVLAVCTVSAPHRPRIGFQLPAPLQDRISVASTVPGSDISCQHLYLIH